MVMFGFSSSESVVVGALAFVINETIAEPAKVESEKIEIFSLPTFRGEVSWFSIYYIFRTSSHPKYGITRVCHLCVRPSA